MAIEIERKFLVSGEGWRQACRAQEPLHYRQGYLATGDVTVRVRICDGQSASLAVKGRRLRFSRLEFEYPIAVADAEEMLLRLAPKSRVEKTRHAVRHQGCVWNVDEFEGALAGLVLAEIELCDPYEDFALPDWVGREVTGEPGYRNSVLAETGALPMHPFADALFAAAGIDLTAHPV
jgi:adenylate cyclase